MRLALLAVYASLGISAAVVTVSLAAVTRQRASGDQSNTIAHPPLTDCAGRAAAYLTSKDLGPFSVITVEDYRTLPYRGGAPRSRPPVFVTHFVGGRLTGFIANIAVTGPDRPAEDALARSLGYRVGRWPLVPLQGPIVRHNHGLLEVYETGLAFATTTAATAWIETRRGSVRLDPQARLLHLPDRRMDGFAYASLLGPNDGAHEREIVYTVRFGTRVLAVAFQGGSALRQRTINGYWERAVWRFVRACG